MLPQLLKLRPVRAAICLVALAVPASGADIAARQNFNLPTDTAEKSLKRFSEQSGRSVMFATDKVRDVRTNPVEGAFTPPEALARLLAGTPLRAIPEQATGGFAIAREPINPKEPPDPNGTRAARTTPSDRPSKNHRTPGDDAAPIELSPFTVNADSDVGYVATNTLAGSRLNTPLKDTAASISIMTEEFLSDIGATNLDEALLWGNNVQEELADDPGGAANNNPNGFFGSSREYRIRGVKATVTRNYFEWNLPRDAYNVERVEESRGPNSVLFGIGNAGGIINTTTKRAITGRSFRRAAMTFSSFNGYRGTIDLNQAATDGKLGVRLNAVHDEGDSYLTHGGGKSRGLHLAGTYQVLPRTRLRAEYEIGDNHSIVASYPSSGLAVVTWLANGRVTLPSPVAANVAVATANAISRYGAAARVTYVSNNDTVINMANQNFGGAAVHAILDPRIVDININQGGPGQFRTAYYDALSVFIEQQLGTSTHLELAYNHQHTNSVAYQAFGDSGTLSFDPNLSLPGNRTNAFGGKLMFDGTTVRRLVDARSNDLRLTLSTEIDAAKWGHYRIAAMGEYERRVTRSGPQIEVWAGAPFNAAPENAVNNVYRRTYVATEGDWGSYYRNMPTQTGLVQGLVDPVSGRTLSSTWVAQNQNQQHDPNHQTTLLLGLQARYFKNRLVLGLGYREDRLNVDDRGSRRNPGSNIWETDYDAVTTLNYKGRTSTLGAVFHVTPKLSLLYNRADNFSLPNLGLRILPDSLPSGNPEGMGQDIGVNLALIEGKLHARAVYYKSGMIGAQGQHGFGSTTTNPTVLTQRIVDTLVNQGLISSSVGDQHRVTANSILFDNTSEGYELSLTANPTKNWRLQMNYSYTTSFEENIGNELKAWWATELAYFKQFPQSLATEGGSIGEIIAMFEENMATQFAVENEELRSNRNHKANAVTRYTFATGPLKGLFIGGGYRYQSKNLAGRTPVPQSAPIWGRAISVGDAFAGYSFRRVPVVGRLRLQLNVANVFNEDDPLVTLFFPDGFPQRIVRVVPRTWRLTASMEF